MEEYQFQILKMEETCKTLQQTAQYSLEATIRGDRLGLSLVQFGKCSGVKFYTGQFQMNDFDPFIQQNFTSFENLCSFLADPKQCKITKIHDKLHLMAVIKLPNGADVNLPAGQIQLSESISTTVKEELLAVAQILFSKEELRKDDLRKILQIFLKTLDILGNKAQNEYKKIPPNSQNTVPERSTSRLSLKIPKLRHEEEQQNNCYINQRVQKSQNDKDQIIEENQEQAGSEKTLEGSSLFLKIKREIQQNNRQILKRLGQIDQKLAQTDKKLYKMITCSSKQGSSSDIKSMNSHYGHSLALPEPIYQKSCRRSQSYIEKNESCVQSPLIQQFQGKTKSSNLLNQFLNPQKLQEQNFETRSEYQKKTNPFPRENGDFLIKNNIVIYTGNDWTKTQLLGKKLMQDEKQFSILIRRTKRRYLWVGVMDSQYKDRRWSWGAPNWVYYFGWNGKVYEGPNQNIKTEGPGFKQDDIVTVKLDFEKGEIQWFVMGKVVALHQTNKLKDTKISWVPLVKFFDHGDSIQWLPSSPSS